MLLPFIGRGQVVVAHLLNGNVNDALGTYNGTATNVTYKNGILNQAGYFAGNGSDVFATLTDLVPTAEGQTMTLSYWLNSDNDQVNVYNTPVTLRNSFNHNFDHAVPEFKGAMTFKSGTSYYNNTGPVTISKNVWHYIVVTYDGTYLIGYMDGVNVGSNTNIGSKTRAGAYNNYIGCGINGSGVKEAYFTGKIDEVIVSKESWSQVKTKTMLSYYKGFYGQ